MPSIAFRLDSSNVIGNGHFYRSLNLAKAFANIGWTTHLITRLQPSSIVSKVAGPWHLHSLNTVAKSIEINDSMTWFGVDESVDAAESHAILDNLKCDWLVVDHYAATEKWLQRIKTAGTKVLVIDDEAKRQLPCDMLLNNNFGALAEYYRDLVPNSTQVLTSTHYAILADKYQVTPNKTISEQIDNVLIAMGGTDPNQTSLLVYRHLRSALPQANIKIALGQSASGLQEIKMAQSADHKLELIIDADLFALNQWCDIAFGACGISAWERNVQAVPSVLITTAENQVPGASRLNSTGANIYLGHWNTITETKISNVLAKLTAEQRKLMSKLAASLVNASGIEHLVKAVINSELSELTFRPAVHSDVALFYHWQLESNTRRYFRNKQTPSFTEHVNWFERILNSKVTLLVAHFNGIACGYIRIDEPNENSKREISILIADGFKGKKIGQKALSSVNEQFSNLHLIAEVLPENKASQKIFLASGYTQTSQNMYERRPLDVK